MHSLRPTSLHLATLILLLAVGNQATAESPSRPKFRVSTIANNGMPKNIVKPGARWNFGPGSLWTHQGWQYAAYWDDARQVSVARRQLPSGAWAVVSLPGYQRTTNRNRGKAGPKSRGFGDGHEKVAMGISPDGVIHLAFDHHVSTLHYRSTKAAVADDPAAHAWNAKLFGPVRDHLGGGKIVGVTYPNFAADQTGFSLYLRLNGGSGSADSHFLHYAGGRWTTPDPAAGKLIDKHWTGGNKTVNAYPHGLAIQNGRRHLTWCWRDTPDATTCHDLCYAYSDDHGETWLNNDGKLIGRIGSQFISADSPGVSVWPIPQGTKYVNGGSMTVDDAGRVHVLMRGEGGSPAYFGRDPETGKWIRRKAGVQGSLVAGRSDQLYVVSEDGLWRTSAKRFGKLEALTTGQRKFFADSKMGLDRTRAAHDGWISVIGQNGKNVTVIDYWVGKSRSTTRD